MNDSMQAYLESKRSVDDRALNDRVFRRFASELHAMGADDGTDDATRDGATDRPVRIVEIGAGIGAMIGRLADRGAVPESVSYRAIDVDGESVGYARKRVPEWLREAGYEVDRGGSGRSDREGSIVARGGDGRSIGIEFDVGDAFESADDADAVIAAAFLDIVDLDAALHSLPTLLRPGGLCYAPITFDAGTGFAPVHPMDGRIERLYHRHMDEIRDRPGSSRTGRELLAGLPSAGFDVLAAGGSDWIVRPRDGSYPAREREFLRHILETIEEALAAYPEDVLAEGSLESWLETRRAQLDRRELHLIANHVDVLARWRG